MCDSHGPALKRGDGEEREHGLRHVVEVEVVVGPLSIDDPGPRDVAVLVHDERTPTTATRSVCKRLSSGFHTRVHWIKSNIRGVYSLALGFRHFGSI